MSNTISVGKITDYIKGLIEDDPLLRRVSVSGEVSNCKYHSRGHIYFKLKDEKASLSAVLFANVRAGLDFKMKDGDKVIVTGRIGVYKDSGSYQLYADKIELDGQGELYARFLKLKTELEEMGMFDESYKQPIPGLAGRVGIVTASTGAAVHDIITVSKRRNPYIELVLFPAQVQGEGAAESIVKGIETLDRLGNVDVIIVGRGGGSIEDLWAFNEEIVARAIFECRTPIISAVGHEVDFTIADFVADKRAATPSQAAEMAVCDMSVLLGRIEYYSERCMGLMNRRIEEAKRGLKTMEVQLLKLSPESRLADRKHKLATLSDRLDGIMSEALRSRRSRLEVLTAGLDGLSPLKKLSGGYSYVSGPSGRAVTTIEAVRAGDEVTINVTDGAIRADVTGCEKISREDI